MIKVCQILIILFLSFVCKANVPSVIKIDTSVNSYEVSKYAKGIEVLNSTGFQSLIGVEKFSPLDQLDPSVPVHWVKFNFLNPYPTVQRLFLSVSYSDSVELYSIDFSGKIHVEKSGDLVPLHSRVNKTGKMVIVEFDVPPSSYQSYYLKLKSITSISRQFKSATLKSMYLYSSKGYEEQFRNTKLFQAFHFGAVLIMLFYNLIIFLILRYRSYFFYVVFLFVLIVFLASNNGNLLELLWPSKPRMDLYIRFFSAPLLMISYLIFGSVFLETERNYKNINRFIYILLIYFIFSILLMTTGFWLAGRTFVFIGVIFSLLLMFYSAIKIYKRGYSPARYFIFANALLFLSALFYTLDYFKVSVDNQLTENVFQVSTVIQLALFSIGLSERANVVDKELVEQKLANAQLEKESEIEKKVLVEEKNKELEQKVKERTLSLEQKNKELMEAEHLIREQNEELAAINSGLEAIVQSRTKELNLINDALEKSNKELDLFIYRTAHDIRGPLARVLGLCHVGLLEVSEEAAIDYLKKLQVNAQNLNHILSRLSAVYQINTLQIRYEEVAVHKLTHDILKELSFYEGFENLTFIIKIDKDLKVFTDKTLLKFILMNLIENGIKYQRTDGGDKGFVQVEVKQKENQVFVNVKDNGIGISPEDAPNIFDMFSKAALKYNNAGLGLYMVRISVEKLNGKIAAIPNNKNLTEIEACIEAGKISVKKQLEINNH